MTSNKHNDPVNHPEHYTSGKVECIDALEAATVNLSGIEAVCTANVIKYLWCWKQKNGIEDLKKARWYLDKLISNFPQSDFAKGGEIVPDVPPEDRTILNRGY